MKKNNLLLITILVFLNFAAFAQQDKKLPAKGKLFIIGGGSRSPELIQALIQTAQLSGKDYIVVLPMSSAEPDSSFYYIKKDLVKYSSNVVTNMNFSREDVNKKRWLDSLKHAKLIFITGGDQNRFMNIVLHTPVHDALIAAYKNGSTIAGTSAGAAVMSKKMITGNEYSGDSVRSGSFKKIAYQSVELKEGLGLIDNAVIDQHFIARSRYNRLIAVLAENPSYPCIGIDEGTAIIVTEKKVTVTGVGQVIRFTLPVNKNLVNSTGNNRILQLRNIRMDILIAGDTFTLP